MEDLLKHLERDLAKLSDHISELSGLVVDACERASVMLTSFDRVLASEILEREEQINEMEVEIEEECLKVLALHQPVAADLRFVILVLKVNNDLERIGDQVVNIAERVNFLADKDRVVSDVDLPRMGEIAARMVQNSVQSMVFRDSSVAREVLSMDDDLDALHAQCYDNMKAVMMAQPTIVPPAVSYLTISSNLERIGDLATNIAEEVIFMEEGEVIRHQES